MTWFKVDDGLHKHRKRIRTGISVDGFAAIGLWTIAGSWSSDELSDGWIADEVLEYLAPGFGELLASRLQHAGLWHREERDGEKGWQFHQWEGHQPLAEKVLAERAEAAERQRKARERAKSARDSRESSGELPDPSRRESQRDDDRTHADVTTAVTVPPTRPDPTRPVLPPEVPKTPSAADAAQNEITEPPDEDEAPTKAGAQRGTRIPDDFKVTPEMVEWARTRAPDVDGRLETEKFINHWIAKTGKDATKRDWLATWRNWMLTAQQRISARASPNGRRYGTSPGAGSDYVNPINPEDEYATEIPT